jgi:predicted DsbA family dithiol-disulfide isomerase
VRIDIWSDVVCPWCYIGKRRFEHALAAFPHGDDVEVVWRSFELDPNTSAGNESLVDRLARKYAMSRAEAQRANDRVTQLAAVEGLEFNLDEAQHGNTFDAHRVIHLAAAHGRQDVVKERFLRGYFTEAEAISDHKTLTRLAVDAGLDEDDVRAVLSSDAYADEVRADEAQARAYGITGVPFFVLAGKYGISGAQPTDLLVEALAKAWSDAHPIQLVKPADEAEIVCTDDVCAI